MVINKQILRRELYYALGFAAASLIQTYFTCYRCTWPREYLMVTLFSFLLWVLLWRGNNMVTVAVGCRISWFEFPVRRLIVGALATIGFTLIAVIGTMTLFEKLLNFSFGKSFHWTVYLSVVITILISLILHSRAFLLSWREASRAAEALQKENITARYETLKSQVSPHFLFNSLNALTNLVYEDQDKAAKFIKQLSEVYRYVLDSRDKEVVTLEEEQKFLNSYLFLQQIRFGEKLQLDIQWNGAKSMVAPLVLQMLVENAIKHNVISEEHPLKVKLYVKDDFIVVENGFRKKSVLLGDSPGIGLDNIMKRYEFLTDKKVEVIVTDTFSVKLPMIPVEPI